MAILILAISPVIRAIVVLIGPIFYKITNQENPLKNEEIKMSWFSGMVRGAITFALALQIKGEGNDKKYVISIVLFIVLITTVLSSTMIKKFKKFIGISPI
jgi:NhaP-type Na+/H+ or K+/H+ antiporter